MLVICSAKEQTMSIDDQLFADQPDEDQEDEENAVLVFLKLSDEHFGSDAEHEAISELEDRLAAAIEAEEVGAFDGNEYGHGYCKIYMYGPDADSLYDAIEEPLGKFPAEDGSYAIKRYGGPGAHEVQIDL